MSVTVLAGPDLADVEPASIEPAGIEPAGIEARAAEAMMACLARFGVAKTTLDDVAREAGCSRATLYRYFDGKPALLRHAVSAELARVTDTVVEAARAEASFADAVVAMVTAGAREIAAHRALHFLLAHEPEAVLGHLAFGPGDRVLVRIGDALAPAFACWLEPDAATRAGEWIARVLRSYALMPLAPTDLTDAPAARRFLEQFVIPGLLAHSTASDRAASNRTASESR